MKSNVYLKLIENYAFSHSGRLKDVRT